MGSWLNRTKGFRPRESYMRRSARPLKDWRTKSPAGTRKRLIEDLDEVTSLIVRKRDGFCVTCGEARPELLTCSHFYKRRHYNTRFDLRNCNTQCRFCNERHNMHPWAYTSYFLDTYDTSVMAELFELRNRRETPSTDELKYMLGQYRCLLREMGS